MAASTLLLSFIQLWERLIFSRRESRYLFMTPLGKQHKPFINDKLPLIYLFYIIQKWLSPREGSRELHFWADSSVCITSKSARKFLSFLCHHSCQKILFLSWSQTHRTYLHQRHVDFTHPCWALWASIGSLHSRGTFVELVNFA